MSVSGALTVLHRVSRAAPSPQASFQVGLNAGCGPRRRPISKVSRWPASPLVLAPLSRWVGTSRSNVASASGSSSPRNQSRSWSMTSAFTRIGAGFGPPCVVLLPEYSPIQDGLSVLGRASVFTDSSDWPHENTT